MAYGVNYRMTYKRFSGGTTTIDILKNGYGGGITTLMGASDPLEVMFDGNVSNIFSGTKGSGANINIVATPFSMVNVFTTDPQEYMVKIYNGASGSTLVWQGFLNTGIYAENLNSNLHSTISLKANDGMAVLDMLPYRPDPSTYYSGAATVTTILNNCLNKLALTWTDRRGCINLYNSLTGWIFNSLAVKQENFIDESGVPMSCREVIENIMKSLGVNMLFRGGTIYMVDPLMLQNRELGQQYDANWAGAGYTDFPGSTLEISTGQITWKKTGVSLDVNPPINQLDIKYDPYNLTTTIFNLSDSNIWNNVGTWSATLGSYPNQYKINKTITYDNVTFDGSIYAEAIKRDDGSDSEYYIKSLCGPVNNNIHKSIGKANFSFPFTSVYRDPSVYIRVSADYYVNTRSFDNIYDTSIASTVVNRVDNSIGLKIGGGPDSSIRWQKTRVTSASGLNGLTITQSNIQDAWFTGSTTFQLQHPTLIWDGSINVYIDAKYDTGWFTSNDKNCLIKNIKIEPVNVAGNVLENSGINYNCLKTISNYVIDPVEITTLLGAGPYGISKAAYIDYDIDQISPGLARTPGGTIVKYAHLLGQNFVTQYDTPRLILNGDLKVPTQMMDIQNSLIRWSNNLPGKTFYIVKGTYNDFREYFSATMIDCASTRENINLL
jgi:hypothetical protein